MQAAPALFSALPFGREWSDHFVQASTRLHSAADDVDALTRLEKHNRRSDRAKVETLLADEQKLRTQALAEATGIQKDAARWVDASNHLPQQIPEMERNHEAIQSFDLGPVTAAVERAGADWPEKKSDLEARLSAEHAIVTDADAQWQSTADARRKAAAGTLTGADVGVLLAFEDKLETSAADLPRKAGELKTLSAQLYTSWDKLLVDMQTRDDRLRAEDTHRTHAHGQRDGQVGRSFERRAVDQRSTRHLRRHAQRPRHGYRAQTRG